MLKDKDTQPTLFQEDSPANHSALQEKEKEQMTIDTYGMKLLESSENVNLDGLLGKMLRGLLTSTTAWYSDRCKLIWKKKVSKSNVLLFQLQASVLGIKEKEFGLLPTPKERDYKGGEGKRVIKTKTGYAKIRKKKGTRFGASLNDVVEYQKIKMIYPTPTQDSASERTKKYKQGGTPLTVAVRMFPTPRPSGEENPESLIKRKGLRKAMQHNLTAAVKMFPTPTVDCEEGGEQSKRVEQTKSGAFILRKKNKPNNTFGAKLSDAMLYLNKPKLGGKLNPNFVEFLMGYPMNWTKVDPTE